MKKYYAVAIPLLALVLSGCAKTSTQPAAPVSGNPNQELENDLGTTPTTTPTSTASRKPHAMMQSATRSTTLQPPMMQIDPAKTYTAILHTAKGDIAIALDAKATPKTVNNFVYLANHKFYNTTVFHRTIPGFMIQGGDPSGNGTGGPGYRFNDEPFSGQYTRGTVAMANAGPNTNGSQFFIMHADYPLPANYVIFGHVTSGMEAVDAIATAPTQPGGEGSTPLNPVTVTSVEILES